MLERIKEETGKGLSRKGREGKEWDGKGWKGTVEEETGQKITNIKDFLKSYIKNLLL